MPFFEVDISPWVDDISRLVGGKRYAAPELAGMSQVKTVRGFVQVSGIPQVIANWKRVDRYMRGWATRRTREAAMQIAAQSQVEVPRDTSELGDSMFIIESTADGSDSAIRVDVGYNTDAVDYAWIQHENLSYNHPHPGTKAHYLKDPFDEVGERFPHEVTVDLKKAVEKVNFVASPVSGGIADSDYDDDDEMSEIDRFWLNKRKT